MSPMTTLNFPIKPYSVWFIVPIVPYIVLIIDYDKKSEALFKPLHLYKAATVVKNFTKKKRN